MSRSRRRKKMNPKKKKQLIIISVIAVCVLAIATFAAIRITSGTSDKKTESTSKDKKSDKKKKSDSKDSDNSLPDLDLTDGKNDDSGKMDSLRLPTSSQAVRAKEITVLPIIPVIVEMHLIMEMHPTVLPAAKPTMILPSRAFPMVLILSRTILLMSTMTKRIGQDIIKIGN